MLKRMQGLLLECVTVPSLWLEHANEFGAMAVAKAAKDMAPILRRNTKRIVHALASSGIETQLHGLVQTLPSIRFLGLDINTNSTGFAVLNEQGACVSAIVAVSFIWRLMLTLCYRRPVSMGIDLDLNDSWFGRAGDR